MQIPGEQTYIFGFAIGSYIKQTVKHTRMRIIMIIRLYKLNQSGLEALGEVR